MGLYILQFSLFLAVFYIVYLVFLKKETFFQHNRWYLLLSPCVALILPLINLDILSPTNAVGQAFVNLPPVLLGDFSGAAGEEQMAQQVMSSPNWKDWFLQYGVLFLYGLGFMVAFFLLLKKTFQFHRFMKTGILKEYRGTAYYQVKDSQMACTFYNQIFMGDEIPAEQRDYILQHELVHVSQKHSLDLLFFEALKLIFWFHPAIYAYQKQLSSLHEYIADEAVTRHTSKKQYYQNLLNVAFGTHQISFINQFFNHSLIKKRILMLQKSKSSTRAKLKYLIVLPLIALMLTYVSCSDNEEIVETNTSELPAPPPPPPPAPPADFSKEDVQLMNNLQKELNFMEEEGKGFDEITKAFFTEKGKHIKSKDSYYRFKIYSKWILKSSKEQKIKEGTWNDEDQKNHNYMQSTGYKQTYEDYVAHRKTVVPQSPAKSEGIPFTAIELVPAYPGCDQSLSNDEIKKCTSDKIKAFVNANFNTGLGKKLDLEGVNRVYVRFTIGKDGSIKDVGARAPYPELSEEAERVVNSLPKMQPGMQDGKAVNVLYSLPIIFQIN
ncbi:M56 family metallopeptidase [Mesonia sp. MT50]|uniref:M56 family metallopeptidase n=1 Tax=Mesonia profundi TaxID=3070998 RepID=A0ABU0ZWU1_9FLAO|nr:M56 family metallopeptidase [Mesonia profundi]MDQ7915950.1 M56 family metallopeptidase [Mesonia profundi]